MRIVVTNEVLTLVRLRTVQTIFRVWTLTRMKLKLR